VECGIVVVEIQDRKKFQSQENSEHEVLKDEVLMTVIDGNWVSLRVSGHLRPSTLRGSLVDKVSLTTEVSVGFKLCHHLDGGTIIVPES
jgi:hypothetical protein